VGDKMNPYKGDLTRVRSKYLAEKINQQLWALFFLPFLLFGLVYAGSLLVQTFLFYVGL
jgi:hypothetical protein